jgi:NADPH2:quinone reductase
MKAIRVHENGGPEVLRVESVADPIPGPGEALVRVEATGVNFIEEGRRVGATHGSVMEQR